jgi:LmbE family N-acetylglucosaminyl deacetylase
MEDKKLRIMMIGAHPDDCDLTCGGIAIKYSKLGHKVKFVSVTNGDAGHQDHTREELAKIRAEEARQSALTAGIEYEVLDFHDGNLKVDIPTREKILGVIREFNPDLIFTHRPNDYHPDHRYTSILVQDASYLVMVPKVCPNVPYLKHQPIILYMYDTFKKPNKFFPDITVGIDDVAEQKRKMLSCHRSQVYEWLPWIGSFQEGQRDTDEKAIYDSLLDDDIECAKECRSQLIEKYGVQIGESIKYAEAFEISEYGGSLSKEEINRYFPF